MGSVINSEVQKNVHEIMDEKIDELFESYRLSGRPFFYKIPLAAKKELKKIVYNYSLEIRRAYMNTMIELGTLHVYGVKAGLDKMPGEQSWLEDIKKMEEQKYPEHHCPICAKSHKKKTSLAKRTSQGSITITAL